MMLRILLLPFAWLYGFIVAVRNRLFDLGLKPSVSFDITVISVGNLVAGGTGKSPMVEHLIRLLADRYKIATLSRGYGRRTKGPRIANSLDDASTLGDEPFQFYRKYKDRVVVAVGEDRVMTIPNILHIHPETNGILLDDAFQHRYVKPSFSILLSDFSKPFYKDSLMPAGRLRESRTGAERADVVVISKCPSQIPDETLMAMENEIRKYTQKRVFYTKIRYGYPIAFGRDETLQEEIILVTGIANPEPLATHVSKNNKLIRHFDFKDHYAYTSTDVQSLLNYFNENPKASLLTTEKDMVKLDTPGFKSVISKLPFFYLPIEVEFLKDGEDFDEMVLNVFNQTADK